MVSKLVSTLFKTGTIYNHFIYNCFIFAITFSLPYFFQYLAVSRYKPLLMSSAIELFTNYATICFFIFTYISHILPILTYMHLLDFSKKACFFNLEPFAVCKKSVVHIHPSILSKISTIYNHFIFAVTLFLAIFLPAPCGIKMQTLAHVISHWVIYKLCYQTYFYTSLYFSYFTNFDLHAAFRL